MDDALDDQRRAETGAEPQEEHASTLVAAERLHRRVVHDPHRAPEGGLVVEPDPSAGEVVRLLHRPAVEHRSRIADTDPVVLPSPGELTDARDQDLGGQGGPRLELASGTLSGGAQLDVGAADVDDQHLRSLRLHRVTSAWGLSFHNRITGRARLRS